MQIPHRPAFYARISLDPSGEQVGVKHQVTEGKGYLAKVGWPEPEIYVDNDISAASGKTRPDFERLLADIASGAVDGLSARHLDRLLRRVADLERIIEALEAAPGPVAVTFTEESNIDLGSANGRMLARILTSVAAQESEMKGERVRASRRREAAAGKAHGALGYGYDKHQNIVLAEAAVIKEAAERVLAGDALNSIARDLNERGVPTSAGDRWDARRVEVVMKRKQRSELIELIEASRRPEFVAPAAAAKLMRAAGSSITAAQVRRHAWHVHLAAADHGLDDSMIAVMLRDAGIAPDRALWRAANLRAMLRRGSLAGWREHSPGARGGGGELIAKGSWQPILTLDTLKAVRRATDPMDKPTEQSTPEEHEEWLRNSHGRGRPPKYLLASVLRCGLCGSPMGGGPDGRGGHRYACGRQPGMPERCGGLTVAGAPVDAMVTLAVIDTLADSDIRAGRRRRAPAPADVEVAEQELVAVEQLREEYAQEAAAGELTPSEWRTLRAGLNKRSAAANRTLASWRPTLRVALQDVPHGRDKVQAWWDAVPMARRREVVRELIEKVVVAPSTRGGNRFDPARLAEPVWRV